MKNTIRFILPIIALSACNRGVGFDIEGKLVDKAAGVVYLVAENTSVDTLATAAVEADNTFRLRGRVAEPATAFICDDNGNALAVLLIENSRLRLTYADDGYTVEGGPVNDKYNIIVRRLSNVARQIAEIDPQDETAEEQYESSMAKYRDILSTAISSNLDNIIGVELFIGQESKGMSAEDMRARLAQFSPRMREISAMRRFEEYVNIYERTETGRPFIDMPLTTISPRSARYAPKTAGYCSISGPRGANPASRRYPTCSRHTPNTPCRASRYAASRSTAIRCAGRRSSPATKCCGRMPSTCPRRAETRRRKHTACNRYRAISSFRPTASSSRATCEAKICSASSKPAWRTDRRPKNLTRRTRYISARYKIKAIFIAKKCAKYLHGIKKRSIFALAIREWLRSSTE